MSSTWDPQQYLRFADERSRPFDDLLARIGADDPSRVVDLGCGPGNVTVRLCDRWPRAEVLGIDSSEEMIERARELGRPQLSFATADLRDWAPGEPVDVITCAATLQWVPGHIREFGRWHEFLVEGGWMAFQVPGNFDSPSHVLMHELATSDRWRERLAEAETAAGSSHRPDVYLRSLLDTGFGYVDVWETTYLHLLTGTDPVLQWIKGTGLRPILQALAESPAETEEFLASYGAALRAAYPADEEGRVVMPFRRVFAVARK